MISKAVYLPGLNGLRSIAAIAVVMAHTLTALVIKYGLPFYIAVPVAQYAVTLFFVISGFLITYLLLLEKDITEINIRNFYKRRILRIWPLYYLFISICLLFSLFDNRFSDVASTNVYWYIFFAANIPFIYYQVIDSLSHLWSIGVEEQFYALWPWIVKYTYRKLTIIVICAIVALFTLKISFYFVFGKQSIIYLLATVLRFHSMMIGALGAIIFYTRANFYLNLIASKLSQVISWTLLILTSLGIIHIPSIIGHEFISLLSVIIILGQVTVENRVVNLENSICNRLGAISYGIYIIHPIVIIFLLPITMNDQLNVFFSSFISFVLVLFITIVLANLSYHYFEKKFLILKNKFAVIKSESKVLA